MEAVLFGIFVPLGYLVMWTVVGRALFRGMDGRRGNFDDEIVAALAGLFWPLVLPFMAVIAGMRAPSLQERRLARARKVRNAARDLAREIEQAEAALRRETSRLRALQEGQS